MKKNYKFLFVMIIILCIFSTQAVMAMDNDVSNNMTVSKNDISIDQDDASLLDNSKGISSEISDDKLGATDSDILSAEESFSSLQALINQNYGGVLNLNSDYMFDSSDSSEDWDLNGPIMISNSITINGNGHYLDADSSNSIFSITGDNVILKNITLLNGFNYNSMSSLDVSGKNVELQDCTIEGCFYYLDHENNGGAVYWTGSDGKITNSTFNLNYANQYGGAVYWTGSDGKITNSTFRSRWWCCLLDWF